MPQPADDWQDVTEDDWQDVADEPVATDPSQMSDLERTVLGMPPQSKGMLQQWDENIINQPLSRHITRNGQQVFDPKAAANYYDDPAARTEDQWKIPSWVPMVGGGSLRSLGAGMLEGAGSVVEGLTTPLNLATAGAGGVYNRAAKTATTLPGLTAAAYTTAPKVANVARRTTQALSAPMVASGAARASEGYRTGEYGDIPMGIAEMAGGAAGAVIPKIGGGRAAPIMPDELPLPKKKLPQVDDEGNLAVSELMAVRRAQQAAREGLPAPIAQAPEATPNLDPNYAGGEGDPMLAGSEPYKAAPVAPEIPVVTRESTPSDYAMDNAYTTARGGEVSPQMAELAKPKTEASPAPFNPATLEFVDPKTGEIKPAGKAQPGDVPLIQDDTVPAATDNIDTDAAVPSTRRAGKLANFVSNLVKSESGEFNPNWAEEFRAGRNEPPPIADEHRWVPEVASPWHPISGTPEQAPVGPRDVRWDAETDNYFDRNTRDWEDLNDVTPEEQARAIGINTGDKPDPTASRRLDITGQPYMDAGRGTKPPEPFRSAGKGLTLNELEATKRTPGMQRLGAMIGADRAAKLKSGETKIDFAEKPIRGLKGKKLEETAGWDEWGDNQVKNVRPNKDKPGLHVREPLSYHPKEVEMEYRDAQGEPLGVLRTDKNGKGIAVLAVSSKLGLRRGKVMFALMKEAFDRGITEPSGDTSPKTKNFIERIKKIVSDDKGEAKSGDITEAIATKINKLIDEIGSSKMGKAVGKFLKDESGEAGGFKRNPTAENWEAIVKELDAEKAPDHKYRDILSTGGKDKLKRGETWRSRVTGYIKSLDDRAREFIKDESGEGDIGPPKLPKELRGAKPRFNVGADSYFPNFADDLDKALYIVSQNVKSKADASYMKFVQDQTGLSEVAARNLGQKIRGVIKKAVVGKETGKIDIPPVARAKQLEARATKQTPEPAKPALTPREYTAGKPQVDTGPLVPENVVPASPAAPEVVASLAQRLKRATEDASTPNAVAPEDISKLIDEATQVMNQMPEGPEKAGVVRQVLAANKAILTSWDMSAPGRQGKAFILNKSYWTAVKPMIAAWKSKGASDLVNQSIIDHPSGYFEKPIGSTGKQGKSFAEKMGLDLASTEEAFSGVVDRTAGKLPGVARSGRAHTAFLNKLRSDQFVSMMDKAKKAGRNPETDIALAKTYAKFINDATGRGSVNIGRWKLERNLGALNDVFFAPKNMSGQIRTWNAMLNPHKYWMADSVVRQQALKSLFAVAGMGVVVGQAAGLAGAAVSNDPFSADFQKIKIGDTRIDLFGGYQQFPVAAMKFMFGKATPTSGDNAGQTQDLTKGRMGQSRFSVAERYFINRLSPVGSFIYAWMSGREFDGEKFEVKRALYERTLPIAVKDIAELAQEDPALALMLGPATLTGLAGTQTYSGK